VDAFFIGDADPFKKIMKKELFLFISVFLLLTGCIQLKEVSCTGVQGFKLNRIDMAGIDGDIQLAIKNNNTFKFVIYPSEFDISYSGIYLGRARLARKVKVKGHSEESYSFNLKKDFQDVSLAEVMKLLNGATLKNTVEVKGNLKIGRFYIKRNLPVDVKEKIKLN
jgi:LEA14-like dessication related protein